MCILSAGMEILNGFYRALNITTGNRLSLLCASAALLAISVAPGSAQTNNIPLVTNTTNKSGTSTVTLTGLPTSTSSDASVVLNLFGDINGGNRERIEIRFDGVLVATRIGVVPTEAACTPQTLNIVVTQAVLAPLIADGQIDVNYQAGPSVNNNIAGCGGVAFRSSGTLTYADITTPNGNGGTDVSGSIARFLQDRARALVQNQPDVLRFVDGRTEGHFNLDVTQNVSEADLQSGALGPFWVSLQGSRTDSSLSDQTYVLGSFGSHAFVGNNAIIGAMIQLDYSEKSESGIADTIGNGWLAGPYFAAQLGDHPLFVDGRLLYGRTDNEITPFGAPTDDFDGERWLGMLGLEGKVQANNLAIFPGVEVSYVKDSQDAYMDSTANLVPSQSVEQTEVALSLDFETPIPISTGDMMLTWGVSGIWSTTDGSGTSASIVQFDGGWRGRVDLGYRFDNGAGWKSDASAYVDGLGDGYESIGLSVFASYAF